MATQIKLRRDTSTNWTANSTVVLAEGEIGVDLTNGQFKLGNGTSTWAQLTYFQPGAGGGGAVDRLTSPDGDIIVTLDNTGTLTFPSQETNNRTGSAEALVFAKSNTQKSIATKTGTSGAPDVERLVIAGGDSYFDGTSTWSGEGGDLYLWAGRGADGGDIKVDAGNSLNAGNQGGTIKIRGGSATTGQGGSILIQPGGSDGNINGDVTIQNANSITHSTQDNLRNYQYTWQFKNNGVLHTNGAPLIVDQYIRSNSNYTGIGAKFNNQGTNTVRFLGCDGTSKSVYTVDANVYDLGGIDGANVNTINVWFYGQLWQPLSVTYDSGTRLYTFTFPVPIEFVNGFDYTVDWLYPNTSAGVEINAGDNYWWFSGSDGKIWMPQGGEFGEETWITPIESVSFGTTTVITLTANEFGMATTGQVIIQGVPGGHPLNGTWYFQAVEVNAIQLYAFEDYSIPIDSTGWTAWSGGGTVRLAKEVVLTTNSNKWRFGYDGSTNFPNGKQVKFSEEIDAYIQAGSATPFLTDGLNLVGGEEGVAVVAIDNSDPANAVGRTWQFKKTGDLELPAFVPGQSGGAQFDAVQGQNVTAGAPPTVVFTSTSGNVESIKALITVISTGAPTGNGPTVTIDTQICEMLITTRYQSYDGGSNVKTAVATVYGVTHTSDVPLATFTVNLIQNFGAGSPYGMRDVIQILAEPTAAVVTLMSVKTVATEILNYF